MARRPRLAPLLLCLSLVLPLACAERDLIDVLDPKTLEERPFPTGELYAACDHGDACLDEWCLSPVDEPGFCTQLCDPADADVAAYCGELPSGSGTAAIACVQIGEQAACALDCDAGRSCPSGMRCEQVDVLGEPRAICF